MAKLFSLIIISFLFVIINANDTYSNEYMQNRKDVDGQSYQSSAEATPVHYKNDNNIIYGSKPNNNEYNNPNIYTDIYKPTTTQQTTTKATYEIYEPKLEEDKVYDHKMEDKKENNHSYQTTSHKTNANIYEPKSNEEISYGHMMENKKHQENFNSYITPSSTQSTSTKGYEMNSYASQYEQSSNIYEQDTTTSMNVYENTYENEMDMNRYEKPTENKYEQGMNQYEQENKVENIYGEGYSADYNKMSQNSIINYFRIKKIFLSFKFI